MEKKLEISKTTLVLIPLLYLCHLYEEYNYDFVSFVTNLFYSDFNAIKFIWINSIAMALILIFIALYFFNKIPPKIIFIIAMVLFVNGVAHTVGGLLIMDYVPGMVSGLILYIPFGIYALWKDFPGLDKATKFQCIRIGVALNILVALIAIFV